MKKFVLFLLLASVSFMSFPNENRPEDYSDVLVIDPEDCSVDYLNGSYLSFQTAKMILLYM